MPEKSGSLMAETIKLLKRRTCSLKQLADELDISYYWLRKFAYGEIADPSVNTVQKLYEYLSSSKLKVKVDEYE